MSGISPVLSRSKKAQSIGLLAEGKNTHEVAAIIGVHEKTIKRWLKQPDYCEELHVQSLGKLKEKLPQIYDVLAKNAHKGSHQHIKIMLEHLERMDAARRVAVEGHLTFQWRDEA